MRLSRKLIVSLQAHFFEYYGIKLSDEDAQQIGLKVTRFVYAKEMRLKRGFVRSAVKEYN